MRQKFDSLKKITKNNLKKVSKKSTGRLWNFYW